MSNLFQDSKTGKLVEFINKHDKEYAMVRDAGGNIAYVGLEQLVPYDREKGRLAKVAAPQICLLYTSPSPRDATLSRMPSSA